jgi:hypothetical protein
MSVWEVGGVAGCRDCTYFRFVHGLVLVLVLPLV